MNRRSADRRVACGAEAVGHEHYFDTVAFDAAGDLAQVLERAASRRINLRQLGGERLAVAFDETVGLADIADVVFALTGVQPPLAQLALDDAVTPPR